MQQHPVPQNVVGFQFKLIGDMTVKQFIFLAAGVLIGYFFFKQVQEPYFKWPLAIGFFGGGFAFAFLPYDDRPLNQWTASFLTSIYKPTMFLWEKSAVIPEILQSSFMTISHAQTLNSGLPADKSVMEEYVQSLPENANSPLDQNERLFLQQLQSSFKKEYGDLEPVINTRAGVQTNILSGMQNRDNDVIQSETLATMSSSGQKVFSVQSLGGQTKVISSIGMVKVRPLGKLPGDIEEKKKTEQTKKTTVKNINADNNKPASSAFGGELSRTADKLKTKNDLEQAIAGLTGQDDEPEVVHATTTTSAVIINDQPTVATTSKPKTSKPVNKEPIIVKPKILTEEPLVEETKKETRPIDNKPYEDLKTLQDQLTKSLAEKQSLRDELQKSRKKTVNSDDNVVVPKVTMKEEKKESTTVKFVPNTMSAQIGVQQPTTPNILAGIVKDQTGDILPEILIEIKNKDGKTERALKTNRLGQFSIATKLDNGVYTISFEDARGLNQFDIIELTLDGKIFPAMEVKAKNQQDAEREKLRAALFGKQN